MNKIFDQLYFKSLLFCIVLETISLLAFFWPIIALPCLVILGLAALVITAINPRYGAYLILLELAIGGLGYLLDYNINGFRVPLRLILFISVFIGWLIYIFRNKDFSWLRQKPLINFSVLLVFLALGIALAIFAYHRSLTDIFSDANAYLFFGLIGLFLTIKIDWQAVIKLLLASTLATSIKTFVGFCVFSSGLALVNGSHAYKWLRDTKIGEITHITDNLYRLFFQSHIYNLFAILVLFVLLFSSIKIKDKERNWLWILLWLNFLTILISQSRSFWLALIFCAGLYFIYLLKHKADFRKIFGYIMIWPLLLISTHLALNIVMGTMQNNVIFARASSSASQGSASSREAQLTPLYSAITQSPLWGSGFSKTITYQSSDPRIRNSNNPEGWYTTSAFEWGYLDIIVKIGIFGLLAYLAFIGGIFKKLIYQLKKEKIYAAFILGLIALLFINIFTPYLNHPLGIGYLLLLLAI